jgi:hypothetical protein
MSRRLIVMTIFAGAICAGLAGQAPQSGGVTVYEGARLIAGDGSAPI